jgi:hypothetical protein
VKKFCYTRDPDSLDIAMHVYFRIAQLRSTPLLPALRHLLCPDISQSDFLISGVCLFLAPSLQTLEFFKITGVEDKLTGTFLHTLWDDGAQLDAIAFRGGGLSPGTLNLILNFHKLRRLELTGMGSALELEWLKKLGAMPKLDDLAVDFTHSQIEVVETELGFRELKSLMITAPLAFTRSVLPYITSPSLEVLVAASASDTATERTGYIEEVIGRWGSSIRDFSLVHLTSTTDSTEEVQMINIAPLIPLKQLTGFRLEGYNINLTDDHLRILGSAWPNLTKLLLPFAAGSDRVRPTIDSLRILAELCPKLEHLRLPLNTLGLPNFVPPPAPSPILFSPTQDSTSDDAASPASATSTSMASLIASLPLARLRPHGLQRLTIATSDDTWESKQQLNLARHIDYLFPRLRRVSCFEDQDSERWSHVHEIVRAFQTVRTEALTRQRLGSIP